MQNWFLWLFVGILSVAAGILALANPFAATVTAELLIGYLFIAIGLLTLVSAFQDQGWAARIWALLLGALMAVFGFNLVLHPLEGIITLTFLVASLMLVMGVLRLVMALTPLAAGARLLLIFSGGLSILLAVMIFSNFPWSSAVVLGVFLAIELISNGVSMIFVSLDRREATPSNA
ncbi:HdeD family acid-resistance protein [Guyparkeria sp.]|uniref:HdeD family acid-resistance protein n=1 Tax=Chromatiales TaxID=135613 RepID=UPI003563FED9